MNTTPSTTVVQDRGEVGPKPRRIRALHLFGGLNRGGAETWLMDVMRSRPGDDLAIDVCLTTSARGAYENEFTAMGGRVHHCRLGKNPWRFAANLQHLLKSETYDVVHSHLYYFSGWVLRAAAQANVPRRIAHNHPVADVKAGLLFRPLYAAWMRRWIATYGTDFVGPTQASMQGFWGPGWESDLHKRVIYNGVRVDRFRHPRDPEGVRKDLGLPPSAAIVLNVARFAAHKRQAFLADVAQELARRRDNVYFVLIGDGPLRTAVEHAVGNAGLSQRFRFVRGATSIDRFWLAADVFAFPSVNEGFGIVIAEAAAAGLPVIAHDIPGVREAAAACTFAKLLPPETSAAGWADAIGEGLDRPALDEATRGRLLDAFPFTIEASIRSLRELYGLPASPLRQGNGRK